MDIVTLTPGTDLARMVRLVSRKRRAIMARPATQVTLSGTYWEGGSRSDYFLVDLNTWQVSPIAGVAPPQFGGPQTAPVQTIQPHQAVIEAGTFCGRPGTPTVYLHPDRQM